jgi:hypothetical protein
LHDRSARRSTNNRRSRPLCGEALSRRPSLRRQAASGHERRGILHPNGVLLGRSPPCPVERDRPCRQDVDDPGEQAQDWQKDPRRSCRPAHRRCARRPRANGRDPIERTCLSDRLLGAPIGWTAMPDKVRDLEKTAVVQGFRSSFRDWGRRDPLFSRRLRDGART